MSKDTTLYKVNKYCKACFSILCPLVWIDANCNFLIEDATETNFKILKDTALT